MSTAFGEAVLRAAELCDSFNLSKDSSRPRCLPLLCDGAQVGLLMPDIMKCLLQFNEVFEPVRGVDGEIRQARLSEKLKTVGERSAALQSLFLHLRHQNAFPCLKGWRDEVYAVSDTFGGKDYFHCERAAARLIGVRKYGVHVNGYYYTEGGEMVMWIGKRSAMKPKWPGLLDNIAAGGIRAGLGALDTLLHECYEEASIPEQIAMKSKPVGALTYCRESVDGVEPETLFIYDLELPRDFVPRPHDGEVEEFQLWTVEKIKMEAAAGRFKPNCILVIAHFLIRHGLITPDKDPMYERLASVGHVDLFRLFTYPGSLSKGLN